MEKQAVADTVMVRLRNRIPIEPNSGFRIYRVDMSDVPGWTSNITHLRLDPADELPDYWTRGAFAIDWIRIGT